MVTLHMSAPGVSPADTFAKRALAVRAQFVASGTSIAEWAKERGFSRNLVQQVLAGNRACIRGESHRIAVALGLKADVPPPGAPLKLERLEGVRP